MGPLPKATDNKLETPCSRKLTDSETHTRAYNVLFLTTSYTPDITSYNMNILGVILFLHQDHRA